VKTTAVGFGYGSVTYRYEIEAVPPSSKTEGNVTINNSGSPGCPAHYEVEPMITVDHDAGGVIFSNTFHWKVVVVGLPKNAPYSEIDAEAARQIAPMLRDAANLIEKQVADYDARTKETS